MSFIYATAWFLDNIRINLPQSSLWKPCVVRMRSRSVAPWRRYRYHYLTDSCSRGNANGKDRFWRACWRRKCNSAASRHFFTAPFCSARIWTVFICEDILHEFVLLQRHFQQGRRFKLYLFHRKNASALKTVFDTAYGFFLCQTSSRHISSGQQAWQLCGWHSQLLPAPVKHAVQGSV